MSFADHKIQTFTKKITALADQPNMQPDELKAYFDSSPEELRQAHNDLCDALTAPTAAANIGFAQTAGVPAGTVQAAIENVQSQVTAAIIGSIPSGSIDGDKLAQDVRDRLTAIETAAANETNTRAGADTAETAARTSADANLQTQINAKCEMVCGSYVGNGTMNRLIHLGRTPKAALVMTNTGMMYLANVHGTYGGLAVPDSPVIYTNPEQPAVAIVANGFQVSSSEPSSALSANLTDTRYNYIAFF